MHYCPERLISAKRRLPSPTAMRLLPTPPAPRDPGRDFMTLQERASLIAEALEDGQLDEVALMMRCRG